jgi:hypothetical protein
MGMWSSWANWIRYGNYQFVFASRDEIREAAEEAYSEGFAQAQDLYDDDGAQFTDNWRASPSDNAQVWSPIVKTYKDRGFSDEQIAEMFYDFLTPEAKRAIDAKKMKDPYFRTVDRLYREIQSGRMFDIHFTLNEFGWLMDAKEFNLDFIKMFMANCAFDIDQKIDVGVLLRALSTFSVGEEQIVRIIYSDEVLIEQMDIWYGDEMYELITDKELNDEILSLDPNIKGDATIWDRGKLDPSDPEYSNRKGMVGGRIRRTGRHLGVPISVYWTTDGQPVLSLLEKAQPAPKSDGLITDTGFRNKVKSLKFIGDSFIWEDGKRDPNSSGSPKLEALNRERVRQTGLQLGVNLSTQWLDNGQCLVSIYGWKHKSE